MSNYLDNGAVLPHGLLGENPDSNMGGFNKTYRNTALRLGIVIASYEAKDDRNILKLTTEYDVMVVEQNEDKGSTTILYRNCISADGLGSVADFFEKTFRAKNKKTSRGDSTKLKGQNGAIVLVLCLDGVSEKGIIVGAINHPDRKTTLIDKEPHLEGEYNGINIKVEKDGSTTLTFKGATDNDGKVVDAKQGNTVLKIEKDGSYQVNHKTITQRLAKDGKASLTADDDISNTTKKNFNVTATENIVLKATKDLSIECVNMIQKASGTATLECQKLQVNSQSEINFNGQQFQVEAENLAGIRAPTIIIDGQTSLGGYGGQPVLLLTTQMYGIGNLGGGVISTAISNFALRVTAQ